MNKNFLYIVIALVVGLVGGWFLFGGTITSETASAHNHSETSETNQLFTCSMHPQIMQAEAGDCPICGMDLIPAERSAEGLGADAFKLTENAMALANIQTSVVGTSNASENSIQLSGEIVENDDNTAIQPAHFNGRIEKLYVTSLGEKVSKGQAVAKIYAADLVAAQQELLTTYNIRESQPQLYNAVLNKFKNWKIHGSQLDEVLKTGNVKTSFTIYSHVSGVVTEIAVSDGAHIMDGKPIFKVSNLSSVWAEFDVYENQISQFKKGQKINIKTNAYPNKKFDATISFIDPVLNTTTRTVTVRATLNNKDAVFKPGMFVTGNVEGNTSEVNTQTLAIPASAVLWTGERSLVYIKTNANMPVFEMREITLGNRNGDMYQVASGLENGDEIVTNGTFTVDAAAQLQGKKSMMNKAGGKAMTGHEGHLGMENASDINQSFENIERVEVSKNFQKQLKLVYEDYIQLKDALVIEDSQKSISASKKLLEHLEKVDMSLLKDNNAHIQWMAFLKEIKASTISISNTSEIVKQREEFKNLSNHLIKTIQLFGVNEIVYVEYCPMANSNNGAYWLSKEDKVINPYFGDAMLTCGEVKQVIE